MRRLAEFRATNTEDETVLNYFDELEIHPDHIGEWIIVFWSQGKDVEIFNLRSAVFTLS